MLTSLNMDLRALGVYVVRQVNTFFPDAKLGIIRCQFLDTAMERTEYCFSRIGGKYFSDGEQTLFNHLNTDQYAMFLYFLSNTIWREEGDLDLASKVYYLNKVLHSVDVFYEVELPDIFRFLHPIGTVLGRGTYSDYFVVYQGCTVGADPPGTYPTIGKGVVMYPGSAIVGNSVLGDNCWVSMGTVILHTDIPQDRLVFGRFSGVQYKDATKSVIEEYFSVEEMPDEVTLDSASFFYEGGDF
jgi:serine O-acetyltransferase